MASLGNHAIRNEGLNGPQPLAGTLAPTWWVNPAVRNRARRNEGLLGPQPLLGARAVTAVPPDILATMIAVYGQTGAVSVF